MESIRRTGTLVSARGLSPQQLVAIEDLAAACDRADGITMRLNREMLAARPPDQVNDFLWYEGEALAGFLGLYGFRDVESEATAMVHPEWRRHGIFRGLVEAARAELHGRGTPSIVFFIERASPAAAPAMAAIGAAYEYTEYLMKAPAAAVVTEPPRPGLALRLATAADVLAMEALDAESFGGAGHVAGWLEGVLADPEARLWVVTLNGAMIGKIQGRVGKQESFISGFVIDRAYRGQGCGTGALALALQRLLAERRQPLALEVAAENDRALGIYRGRGFAVVTAYDYYRLAVG